MGIKKVKRIKVIKDYSESEGIRLDKPDSISITTRFTQVYFGIENKTYHLSGKARALLDYFCSVMDNENMVQTNSKALESYKKFVEVNFGVSGIQSTENLRKLLSQLWDNDLLIKQAKGISRLNPKFFYRGESRDREALVRKLYSVTVNDWLIENQSSELSIEEIQKRLDLEQIALKYLVNQKK